jgi:hypothetical protein
MIYCLLLQGWCLPHQVKRSWSVKEPWRSAGATGADSALLGGWGRAADVSSFAARRLGASCRSCRCCLLCIQNVGDKMLEQRSAARRLGASCRRCLLRIRNVGDELPAKLAGCRGGWGWAAAFLYIWLFWWVVGNLPNVLYSGTEGVYLLLWTFGYFVYLLWYWCVSCCHFGICSVYFV